MKSILVCLAFAVAAVVHAGPVWWRAKSLFDPELQLAPAQYNLLTRIDAIELPGLAVQNLRPSEVVSAIRDRLVDARISDIVIRADPALDASDVRITFSQREMRLANALKYLSGLGAVSYTLSGTEIVAVPSLRPNR